MYQNLFSLDYIVNDEKKSVLMSVLNEDFIRMNRERELYQAWELFWVRSMMTRLMKKKIFSFFFFL